MRHARLIIIEVCDCTCVQYGSIPNRNIERDPSFKQFECLTQLDLNHHKLENLSYHDVMICIQYRL